MKSLIGKVLTLDNVSKLKGKTVVVYNQTFDSIRMVHPDGNVERLVKTCAEWIPSAYSSSTQQKALKELAGVVFDNLTSEIVDIF